MVSLIQKTIRGSLDGNVMPGVGISLLGTMGREIFRLKQISEGTVSVFADMDENHNIFLCTKVGERGEGAGGTVRDCKVREERSQNYNPLSAIEILRISEKGQLQKIPLGKLVKKKKRKKEDALVRG